MRGVCARTSLNDRYFYEVFEDRDAMLVAVWDSVRTEVLELVADVLAENAEQPPLETLRIVITAVVDRITQDPGRAQIMLGHHAGSTVLEDRRASALQDATDLIVAAATPHLKSGVDETALRMDVLIGIGGFYELLVAWVSGVLELEPDQIVTHTTRFGAAMATQYLKLTPVRG